MEEKFKPLGDRVLVEPLEEKDNGSGAIISGVVKEKPTQGVVVAVGECPSLIIEEGDKVVYGKYVGSEVILNKKSYIVMRQSDVYGVIN